MQNNDNDQIKIVLLGESKVGKTSVTHRYTENKFHPYEKSTIGAAYQFKEVYMKGNTWKLVVWDTAGQEDYRWLTPMYYRNANIAILVYDVTQQKSFDELQYWTNKLKENSDDDVVIMICGNKIDLENERKVDVLAAQGYARENGLLYAETSAVTGVGIDQMFETAILYAVNNIKDEAMTFNHKVPPSTAGMESCC